jgi:ATP-binding cassette, subfamily B, bacterial PglK
MNSYLTLFKRLWRKICIKRRRQIGLLLILMIATSLLEVVSIGALLPFLGVLTNPDRVFNHPLAQPLIESLQLGESHQLILPLTIIFIIAILISGVMRLVLLWAQTRLSFSIGADFSADVYKRTLYQPYSVHVLRNSSEVIAGISTKINNAVHHIILPILNTISATLIALSIVFTLMLVEPILALFIFISFGSIYTFIIFLVKKKLDRNGREINKKQNCVIKSIQEGIGGIRDILINGTQKAYCDVFRGFDIPLRQAQANVQIISASPRFIIELLSVVTIALVALFLSTKSNGGIIDAVPILGVIALGAQKLLPVFQQVYSSWSFIRSGKDSLSNVLALLEQPLPAYIDYKAADPIVFNKNITLDNVCFQYSPDGNKVLRKINLKILKGSCIGIVGTTGGGKSTLLDVIMGLLSPDEGCLEIDGVKITSINQLSWQAHIAHVPQNIFLSDSTILENIAFGTPLKEIDFERVKVAAEKAQIANVINSWELGYQTVVGEGGIRMSGGQRQRIGIARALYKQADVIIFDEATSSLDNTVESLVIESINSLHKDITIIMVAHRHSTLRNCTKIIEVIDGSILRVGSYDEVILEK